MNFQKIVATKIIDINVLSVTQQNMHFIQPTVLPNLIHQAE